MADVTVITSTTATIDADKVVEIATDAVVAVQQGADDAAQLDGQYDMLTQFQQSNDELSQIKKQLTDNPDDADLKSTLENLTKKQKALKDAMIVAGVPLPDAPLEDVLASIKQWQELYNSMYMTLQANEICFDILKHQPLIDSLYQMKNVQQLDEHKAPADPFPASDADKTAADALAETPASTTPESVTTPATFVVGSGSKEELAATWKSLRDSIRNVIKESMPNLQNLYATMGKVSILSKNYNTFRSLVPDIKKAQSAPKYLYLLQNPCVDLRKQADNIDKDSKDFLQLVVSSASTMLEQVGQENLRANAASISNLQLERKKEVDKLELVYTDEMLAQNDVALYKGKLEGANVRSSFATNNIEAINASIDQIGKELEQIRSNRVKDNAAMSQQVTDARVAYDQLCQDLNGKSKKEQEEAQLRTTESEKKRKAALDTYTEKLSALPPQITQKKTVTTSSLFGLIKQNHTVEENVANPEIDIMKNKMQIMNDQIRAESDQTKKDLENLMTQMELYKKQESAAQGNAEALQKLQQQREDMYDKLQAAQEARQHGWLDRLKVEQTNSETARTESTTFAEQVRISQDKVTYLHSLAVKNEADILKKIGQYDETIKLAEANTKAIVNHYGGIQSDASVNQIMELLGSLLALPRTITKGTTNYGQFRQKILELVENVEEGIKMIDNGASVMAPFEKTPEGVQSWLKYKQQPSDLINNLKADSIDYDTLTILTADDLKDYFPSSNKTEKQLKIAANQLFRQIITFDKDYQGEPGQNDAQILVSQGVGRVKEQVELFSKFSDSQSAGLQKTLAQKVDG